MFIFSEDKINLNINNVEKFLQRKIQKIEEIKKYKSDYKKNHPSLKKKTSRKNFDLNNINNNNSIKTDNFGLIENFSTAKKESNDEKQEILYLNNKNINYNFNY